MVTAHINSTQSLLAVRVTVDVATRCEWDQPVTFQYDGFWKKSGITPGLDFDVVDEDRLGETIYISQLAFWLSHRPRNLPAMPRSRFIQFRKWIHLGDFEAKEDVLAKRASNMAILTHLVAAYDTGGQTAFDAALADPEVKEKAYRMKFEVEYLKTTTIGLARKQLTAGLKLQASGVF